MGVIERLLDFFGVRLRSPTIRNSSGASPVQINDLWTYDLTRGIIDAIATAAAQGQFVHCIVDSDDKIKEIKQDSPYSRVLNVRPSQWMSAFDFWYRMFATLEAKTTAIAFVEWKTSGRSVVPARIVPVDYHSYSFLRTVDTDELVISVQPSDGTGEFYLMADDCIILRKFYLQKLGGGDGNAALAPALRMAGAVDSGLIESLEVSNKVRGVHKHKLAKLFSEDAKKSQEQFAERYRHAAEHGGIIDIDAAEDYTPFSVAPYSATAAQMENVNRRFYGYFRTPEEIVMGTASESVRQSWHASKIRPMWAELEQVLNNVMFTAREYEMGNRIKVMGGGLANASFETRLNYIKETFGMGIATDNDYRDLLGLAPTEGGDRFTLNLMYIDKANAAEYQIGRNPEGGEQDGETS